MSSLTDEAIDTFVEHAPALAAAAIPFSQMIIFRIGQGVAAVPDDATALSHRDAGYLFHPISIWQDPADDERLIAANRAFADAMRPFGTGGAYLNFTPEADRVRDAYGDAEVRAPRGVEGQVRPRQRVPNEPEHQTEQPVQRVGPHPRIVRGVGRRPVSVDTARCQPKRVSLPGFVGHLRLILGLASDPFLAAHVDLLLPQRHRALEGVDRLGAGCERARRDAPTRPRSRRSSRRSRRPRPGGGSRPRSANAAPAAPLRSAPSRPRPSPRTPRTRAGRPRGRASGRGSFP